VTDELRGGYTTGTCAAAAAKAAVMLLASGQAPAVVDVELPEGERISFTPLEVRCDEAGCRAAIVKDAGDDPDITNGSLIVVRVDWSETDGVTFRAGDGVGTVTLAGLSIPPGEPAINPGPRKMIENAVREITDRGVTVTVSIPGGSQLATKTFNPKLGIVGGLSVLGSTGRVRPFSHAAIQESIRCSLSISVANGVRAPIFVPGHMGARAAARHLRVADNQLVEVGNEWGYMLAQVCRYDLDGLLLLGHPGKLAKLWLRQWDTHSARSESAFPPVLQLYQEQFGHLTGETMTVEGIFSQLKPQQSRWLADTIAERIRQQVAAEFAPAFGLSVVLTDNAGAWLGASGDFSLWQPVAD